MNNTNTDLKTIAAEMEFKRVVLSYYRRAGRTAAYALLARLADLVDDGAGRTELTSAVREALASLPTAH